MKYMYVRNDDLIITDLTPDYDNVLKQEGYVRRDIPSDNEVNMDKITHLDFDESFNFSKAKYNLRINKINAEERIKILKEELQNGDYKIVKCYEAQLANKDMPYNIVELLSERDAMRQEINTLEEFLYGST
jgi:hypothetical protein